MKKVLSITIAFVMALTVFAVSPATLSSVHAAITVKAKTTDTVNVRSAASASAPKITSFSKGKTFTVTGATKGDDGAYWYQLTYNSKTCYLKGKYAVRTGLSTSNITKTTGTVTANDINLRLGPSTDYYAVGRAKKGETYNVNGTAKDGSGNTWYRIYGADGFKLYISGTYLSLGGATAATSTTTQTTTPAATQATAAAATVAGTMPGLITGTVNVRSGAGTNHSKKGTLSKGKSVTITGLAKASNGTYWYIINYKNGKGYLSSKYVSRQGYASTALPKMTGTITNTGVNLRLGPGTNFPKYIKAKNKKYTVNGMSTDGSGYVWYRVRVGGKINLYMGSNNISVPYSAPTVDSAPQVDVSLGQENVGEANNGVVSGSGITYPTTLATGSKFTLKGTLSSSQTMTTVETGITDTAGNWLTGYKVTSTPNSTTFDINSNVDSAIKFGSLGAGTYHYVCVATTGQGAAKVFDYTFTVKDMASISISGLTYPTVHNQYKSFTLKGTITSSQAMTQIDVGIMNSNGTWLGGHYTTVNPNSTTYDLKNVDSKIKFGDLATGSYIYRCYVTTATGTQIAFSYSFTVNTNTGIPGALSYGALTGNLRNDIVQVAMAQNGYNSAKENHTVYNLWYYGSDTAAAWCAIFVSWCAASCGVSTGVIPKMAYVPSITSWYKSKGRFNAKTSLPKKGDLIIYSGSSHIGIVTEDVTSTSGKVSTIEGNTGNDEVKYRKDYMKWNSSSILGYCSPAY